MKPFKITTRLAIQSAAHFDKTGSQQASFCVTALLVAAARWSPNRRRMSAIGP